MDMKETKKLFKESIESESVTKQVRDAMKTKTWQKQNMREGFEETFDPLIKSQDKVKASIDKQQTAVINQLQDNQRAITIGLDKIDENNKRVLELNEIAGTNLETSQDSPEGSFSGSELTIINKYGIPAPKDWRKNTKDTKNYKL